MPRNIEEYDDEIESPDEDMKEFIKKCNLSLLNQSKTI